MRTFFSIISVLMVAGALFLAGCGDDGSEGDRTAQPTENLLQPDQVTSNAHIFLYKAGRKTTDLTADEIQQFTALDSSLATNLYVEFFDSTGTLMSTLKARHGYFKEKNNYLAVWGKVEVVGQDSVQLFTEYLEWDAARDSVVTDSFVTIIRQGDTWTSQGMQSDPTLQNISFKHASGRLSDIKKVQDDSH